MPFFARLHCHGRAAPWRTRFLLPRSPRSPTALRLPPRPPRAHRTVPSEPRTNPALSLNHHLPNRSPLPDIAFARPSFARLTGLPLPRPRCSILKSAGCSEETFILALIYMDQVLHTCTCNACRSNPAGRPPCGCRCGCRCRCGAACIAQAQPAVRGGCHRHPRIARCMPRAALRPIANSAPGSP